MLRNILFAFLLMTSVQAQLNGEFWWLNSNLNNFRKIQPPPAKIDVSDFEDDSAKIIFRDEDISFSNQVLKPLSDRTPKLKPTHNPAENKVVWPKDEYIKSHDVKVVPNKNYKKENFEEMKRNEINNKYEDILIFSYPKNEKYVSVNSNKASTESLNPTSTENALTGTESGGVSAEIIFNGNKLPTITTKESQNICTYTNNKKCYELNGFVYEYSRRIPTTSGDEPLVCCILPIQPILNKDNGSHTIHFARTASTLKRYKRSDTEENISLKQRDFLLKHKFSSHRLNVKPASTPVTKIVTPPEDDYLDPYWNVKNTKFQIPNNPRVENTKYDYDSEDQEYTDELPKPGLVGLYSDHAVSPSSWSFVDGNKGFSYGGSDVDDDYEESDEDDDENTFGYSTIDPRQGNKKHKGKGKPVKLTTISDEVTYDAESHTINFQSNPDFHVFQGFKLLNLFRNTSRVHTKNTKKPSDQEQDTSVDINEDSAQIEDNFEENQLFSGCGKVTTNKVNQRGNQNGEAARGTHPWLALVVLTKRRQTVLCYATLVHPRAAVTVADCVHGTTPGDITVMAGLWDLNDRSRAKNRVATVHVHPRYKAGDVDNNLAVLHWMQLLQLNVNIQPACLGEAQIGEECKFFGWGGLDQGIQKQRSLWQRATVRECSTNQRMRTSEDAFCVSTPRGIVTGMGGPLICDIAGHSSIVGVVVSRHNGYVLVPVRGWTMKADNLVSGD